MELHRLIAEIENSAQKEKELYHSPTLEIIEIKVEKGFAASPAEGGSSGSFDWGSGGVW